IDDSLQNYSDIDHSDYDFSDNSTSITDNDNINSQSIITYNINKKNHNTNKTYTHSNVHRKTESKLEGNLNDDIITDITVNRDRFLLNKNYHQNYNSCNIDTFTVLPVVIPIVTSVTNGKSHDSQSDIQYTPNTP